MAVLLSRRRSAPKPYDTSSVPPEFQTRPQPSQVLLDIGTTTDSLDTATYVLEQRILGVFQTVINPPTISVLFHEVCRLHELQVPACVRLRDLERLDQLADAKTFFDCQQATSKAQTEAVAQRVEKALGLR